MDEKDLRSIIEQVLTEMNVSGAKPAEKAAAACACESAPEVEDGCIPDITEIDIRKQYLVKNPENGEEYAELKMNAPCRLGIGKAGARYNTLPQLEFRAAHSAAQDAVFNDVDAEFVEKMGLWTVQTQCDSKDTYLTRPDLGRKLSPEAVETIKAKCKKNPTVQIYVADGLSSAAILANAFPDSALPAVNLVPDGSIPDVYRSDTGIYKLYRAGILAGNDDAGTFRPNAPITRAEVATILVRMADPNVRLLFSLG